MRAIDTNVLVRLLARDDPKQALAAEDFIAPGAWVSTLVLSESIWVLESVYGVAPSAQALALEMLLQHRQITLQDHETVVEALKLFQQTKGLGFSDCLILESARKAGHLPLGTFDRKLAKQSDAQLI